MTKRFIDGSGIDDTFEPWEPVVFTREEIEAETTRLAAMPRPSDGCRESVLVHPRSTAPGIGLAPGMRVTLSVLLPGERTAPIRHNSTLANFCIRGAGTAHIGETTVAYSRYDLFNTPSYRTYTHFNDTDEIHARLTYSNAPLLEKLHVHLVDRDPGPPTEVEAEEPGAASDAATSPFGTFELDGSGAMLMPYERLINPPAVGSRVLHWRWSEVRAHLDKLHALGPSYVGRRLYLLYNPMTGRTNGTTPSFFATLTIRPPGIADRPHRHISAAINYFFAGSGYSRVAGRKYSWAAGDLMLAAPGWAVHNHVSGDDPVYELTIQDQPLHVAMESLLWQEDLKRPPLVLGAEAGFDTNRANL